MTRIAAIALSLFAALSTMPTLRAQAPGFRGALVTTTVQPDTLTVGQPFTVRIRVRAPKIATIRFPPVPDSGDAIEAVDPRYVEDAGDNSVLDRTAVYGLVAWDIGNHTPHFANVVVSMAGIDQQFVARVDHVAVYSVLPPDSSSRVPKEAREPVPPASGAWRYALLAALALLSAGWYVWRRLRRRARAVAPDPEAFESATTAFAALDALALVEAGEPGRHVIANVDVMRAYVARRFPAARESLTTRELVSVLAGSELPMSTERVGALLEHDAGVRYARAPITPEEATSLGIEARAIVKEVQRAHEARQRALDKAPSRQRKGRKA